MASKDGKSIVTFSGNILTTNIGVGGDLSFVESSGVVEGPNINWNRYSIISALDKQTVVGNGFTFSIFNGFVLGGNFQIGPYTDPTSSFQVKGLSIGWEGFRGSLKLDTDSFKVTKP